MSVSKWNNPMLPVLKTLRLLGRTPFTINRLSGELECRLVSWASAWALLATAAQALLAVKVHFWDDFSFTSFNAVLEYFAKFLSMNGVIHSLLTTWWTAPAVAKAYNAWNRFYAVLEEKTDVKITSGILNHSGTVVVVIGMLTWPYVTFCSMMASEEPISSYDYKLNAMSSLVSSLAIFYLLVLFWMWVIFCTTTERAVDVINESLIQSVSGNREQNISDARSLWLELRSCSVAFSHSVGGAIALWLLEFLYDYSICLYEVLQYVLDMYKEDMADVGAVLFMDSFCTFMLFLASSWASDRIHDRMLTTLFSQNFHLLSTSEHNEMELLVNTIELGNPCFEILGILKLDKPQYITILETIITYMVVLVQFYKISPVEESVKKD